MIRAGAPADAVLAYFMGAGLGLTFFCMMVSVKIIWSLYRRWASEFSTPIRDYLVSLAIFLIWFVLVGGTIGLLWNLFTTSLAGAVAVASGSFALALVAFGRSVRRC